MSIRYYRDYRIIEIGFIASCGMWRARVSVLETDSAFYFKKAHVFVEHFNL